MAEGINVRLSGKLRAFVELQTGDNGLFESVSEYVRSLIRQDFERAQGKKWTALYDELEDGINAPEEDFESVDLNEIKAAGKQLIQDNAL